MRKYKQSHYPAFGYHYYYSGSLQKYNPQLYNQVVSALSETPQLSSENDGAVLLSMLKNAAKVERQKEINYIKRTLEKHKNFFSASSIKCLSAEEYLNNPKLLIKLISEAREGAEYFRGVLEELEKYINYHKNHDKQNGQATLNLQRKGYVNTFLRELNGTHDTKMPKVVENRLRALLKKEGVSAPTIATVMFQLQEALDKVHFDFAIGDEGDIEELADRNPLLKRALDEINYLLDDVKNPSGINSSEYLGDIFNSNRKGRTFFSKESSLIQDIIKQYPKGTKERDKITNRIHEVRTEASKISTALSTARKGSLEEIVRGHVEDAVVQNMAQEGLNTKSDSRAVVAYGALMIEATSKQAVYTDIKKILDDEIAEIKKIKVTNANYLKIAEEEDKMKQKLERYIQDCEGISSMNIIQDSMKNYSISYFDVQSKTLKDFEGVSGGEAWNLEDFTSAVSGLSSVLGLSLPQQDWLSFAIVNITKGSVGVHSYRNKLLDYLSLFIVALIFSDGKEVMRSFISNVTQAPVESIHLLDIDGVFIPSSFLLEQIYTELDSGMAEMEKTTHLEIIGDAENYQTFLDYTTPKMLKRNSLKKRFDEVGKKTYNNTKIKIRIMASFFDIIGDLINI